MSRTSYIALNMMEEIGPVKVRALMEHLGAIEAIFEAPRSELEKVRGVGPKLAGRILEQRDTIDVEAEEFKVDRLGARIITPLDDEYPAALKEIHDPPLALYVMGTLEARDKHGLAVVGSRRVSHYGRQTADRFGYQLAKAGFTVVSGLARGIDEAAHQGALKGGGRTLAVLGSALDCLYPEENAPLAEAIARQGAVISEFPLGTQPGKTTFPMRNRIVSGLSMGVLVVEAGVVSGAMITVEEATSQGRLIFAVPGRIDSPGAKGCHRLIRSGAKLVETVDDIIEEFEYLIPPGQGEGTKSAPQPVLTPEEQKLVDVLGAGALNIDTLARESGISAAKISAMLIGLEMKKVIRMLPGRVVELTQNH